MKGLQNLSPQSSFSSQTKHKWHFHYTWNLTYPYIYVWGRHTRGDTVLCLPLFFKCFHFFKVKIYNHSPISLYGMEFRSLKRKQLNSLGPKFHARNTKGSKFSSIQKGLQRYFLNSCIINPTYIHDKTDSFSIGMRTLPFFFSYWKPRVFSDTTYLLLPFM